MTYVTVQFPGGSEFLGNIAALDVDAQNGFTFVCPDELPVENGDEIVGELNAQAAFASKRIFSKDMHPPGAMWEATADYPQFTPVGHPNVDIRWNRHCVSGTRGSQLIDGLPHTSEYDFWVNKGTENDAHPYGACYQDLAKTISTGLIEWLTFNGITTVIVGGLATDYCVKETVLELIAAGFTVILNQSATRGIAEDTTATAIAEMRDSGVIMIGSASELKQVTPPSAVQLDAFS